MDTLLLYISMGMCMQSSPRMNCWVCYITSNHYVIQSLLRHTHSALQEQGFEDDDEFRWDTRYVHVSVNLLHVQCTCTLYVSMQVPQVWCALNHKGQLTLFT